MNKLNMVKKVKKLLALSESSNENEAASAAAMAQKIMVEYNIGSDDLRTTAENQYIVKEGRKTTKRALSDKFVFSILSQCFFVEVVQTTNTKKVEGRIVKEYSFYFVGKPQNVEVAKYLYAFLSRAFKSLTKEYLKKHKVRGHRRTCFINSYLFGIHGGIIDQVMKSRYAAEQENGLIVIKDKNLDKFMEGKFGGGGGKDLAVQAHDMGAVQHGYNDGKNLLLVDAVSDNTKKNGVLDYVG